MHWRFYGTTVGWNFLDGNNSEIHFLSDWYSPVPFMATAKPEIEVDEILPLLRRRAGIRFLVGSPGVAYREFQEICNISGIDCPEKRDEKGLSDCGLVSLHDSDWVSFRFFVSAKAMFKLTRAVWAYSAAQGPKHFSGNFVSYLLSGDRLLHVSGSHKKEFLLGKRPALLNSLPDISFCSGESIPEDPGFDGVLKEIEDQFN